MENKSLFEETHYNKPIILTFVSAAFISILIFITNWGDEGKQLTGLSLSFLLLLIVIVLLLFIKFTIQVFSTKMVVSFGIGIIKKTFHLEDIDISSIEKKIIPWYYGSGIRLVKGGILYNAKPGKAICFRLKNQKKYFIVTDQYTRLLQTLGRNIDEINSTTYK